MHFSKLDYCYCISQKKKVQHNQQNRLILLYSSLLLLFTNMVVNFRDSFAYACKIDGNFSLKSYKLCKREFSPLNQWRTRIFDLSVITSAVISQNFLLFKVHDKFKATDAISPVASAPSFLPSCL